MDFTTFMHGFAASPDAPHPARRERGTSGSGDVGGGGGGGGATRRRGAAAGTSASGAANNPDGNDQRQPQQRWASGDPVTVQSMVATALICTVILIALPLLKSLVRLMALVSLAALYLNNPARDPSTHGRCWELLLNERHRRIAERNSKDLGKFKLVSLVKNALNDTAGLLQGQRVIVDFVFFGAGYLESDAEVDGEYFAVGAMGSWNIVEMAALRKLTAGVAATIHNAAEAAGMDHQSET